MLVLPITGAVKALQARFPGMKRSTVTLVAPVKVLPVKSLTLAVAEADDFKVTDLSFIFKLPPVVKPSTPYISNPVPNVATPLAPRLRLFNERLPVVKFKVPAVPPIVKFEVELPVIVPEPETAPFIVSVLAPSVSVFPVPKSSLPIVGETLVNTGLLDTPAGTTISAPLAGSVPSYQKGISM